MLRTFVSICTLKHMELNTYSPQSSIFFRRQCYEYIKKICTHSFFFWSKICTHSLSASIALKIKKMVVRVFFGPIMVIRVFFLVETAIRVVAFKKWKAFFLLLKGGPLTVG